MKYFIDTEFLEGTQESKLLILKSRLGHWIIGKPKPTIDLISIGIVAEDGREYYAISKDFNLKEAWNRNDLDSNHKRNYKQKDNYRIRENVLKPIFKELEKKYCLEKFIKLPDYKRQFEIVGFLDFNYSNFKMLINKYGKTNKEIAIEIQEFVYGFAIKGYDENIHQIETTKKLISNFKGKVEFYAYYADYDWVAFCWLFGKMIDLPNGFPMYCIDLKQELDTRLKTYTSTELSKSTYPSCQHNVYAAMDYDKPLINMQKCIKDHPKYPKQTNEHNALADAKWNKQLYEFINTL